MSGSRIVGVRVRGDAVYWARAVVVTTGTFLRGLMHVGSNQQPGGRAGEAAEMTLSDSLKEVGLDPSSEPRLPMWETMSEDQILDHLPKIVAVQVQVDDNLHDWVRHLRTRNVSWERIGASLGMTRQSAWERFRE